MALVAEAVDVSNRVKIVAAFLAAFAWPGYSKFERLPKAQQRHALAIAARSLAEMKAGPSE